MSRKQSGFTLIELVVVVAIIGILAAVTIPAFMKNARSAKTAEATTNVKKIYDGARSYFEEEMNGRGSITPVEKEFPEIDELIAAGYVDSGLGSDKVKDYDYTLVVMEPPGILITAVPEVPGVTGDSIITADGAGVVTIVPDPETERVDSDLRAKAVFTIESLDRLTGGAALGMANDVTDSKDDTALILDVLGPKRGGSSTIGTVLDKVYEAATLDELLEGDDGRSEGDDLEMARIVAAYLDAVRAKLQPIVDFPVVPDPPPSDASASVAKLLGEATPVTAGEATAYLVVLAEGLKDAELVGSSSVAMGHRAELVRAAEIALAAIELDKIDQARQQLLFIRRVTDGVTDPRDWIVGAAAKRMLRQTDLALARLSK
jgi:prepilin-type N-terminal cleavage/methylation domain-containing protein